MLFVMLKNDFIIYKDPMNDLHAYLPLSSCPGMTISLFAMTLRLRGRGEGGPGLNVIMTFFLSLEVSP